MNIGNKLHLIVKLHHLLPDNDNPDKRVLFQIMIIRIVINNKNIESIYKSRYLGQVSGFVYRLTYEYIQTYN